MAAVHTVASQAKSGVSTFFSFGCEQCVPTICIDILSLDLHPGLAIGCINTAVRLARCQMLQHLFLSKMQHLVL